MPAFSTLSIVARDPQASIAFYQLLGVELDDHSGDGGGDIVHVTVRGQKPADLDIDSHPLGEIYNAGVRSGASRGLIVGFSVDSRDEVDRIHAAVVAAGHESRQVPYDAFWGARYAIVADPDGNDVGIMSPMDDTMRSWPPTPSPDR
jgi:catechol 2,3-dioxygenase-like lactoylglutathione lyase family enzyme